MQSISILSEPGYWLLNKPILQIDKQHPESATDLLTTPEIIQTPLELSHTKSHSLSVTVTWFPSSSSVSLRKKNLKVEQKQVIYRPCPSHNSSHNVDHCSAFTIGFILLQLNLIHATFSRLINEFSVGWPTVESGGTVGRITKGGFFFAALHLPKRA